MFALLFSVYCLPESFFLFTFVYHSFLHAALVFLSEPQRLCFSNVSAPLPTFWTLMKFCFFFYLQVVPHLDPEHLTVTDYV